MYVVVDAVVQAVNFFPHQAVIKFVWVHKKNRQSQAKVSHAIFKL